MNPYEFGASLAIQDLNNLEKTSGVLSDIFGRSGLLADLGYIGQKTLRDPRTLGTGLAIGGLGGAGLGAGLGASAVYEGIQDAQDIADEQAQIVGAILGGTGGAGLGALTGKIVSDQPGLGAALGGIGGAGLGALSGIHQL